MLKAYKFRIYPNTTTEKKLQWILDRCRELYNTALQERKEAYKYAGRSISYYEQKRDLVPIKDEIRPEYQDIGSHVLQNVLLRVERAMQAFFRRVCENERSSFLAKAGEKPGYPRYQGRNRYDSFCFPGLREMSSAHFRKRQVGSSRGIGSRSPRLVRSRFNYTAR